MDTLLHEALHNCLGPSENHETNRRYVSHGREGIVVFVNEFKRNCGGHTWYWQAPPTGGALAR